MKKNFSTRLLSIFLAVLMIVTTVPAYVLTDPLEAKADVNVNADAKYVFAYFLGDGDGQHVRFAISTDGIKFSPLNGNSPLLQEMTGNTVINTGGREHNTYKNHVNKDGFTRDPFICRKANGNGYYIVGTDLHVGDPGQTGDYNNSRIYVWDVPDIAHADQVKPMIIETVGWFGSTYVSDNDYVAWAPEVIYDSAKGMYMLYWSGPLYASAELKYVYTNDFTNFYNSSGQPINGTNQPETLYKHKGADTIANTGNYAPTSGNTIDGDIAYDAETGYYYLVYKFEAQGQLYIMKSKTLTGFNTDSNHAVKFQDSRISGLQKSGDNDKTHLRFEGPELYQAADGKWILVTDQYAANPSNDYYMYAADSIDDFMTGADMKDREVTYTNIDNCYPRHGAVAKITNEEFNGLAQNFILPDSFPYSFPVSKTPYLGDDLTNNQYGMYDTNVCAGSSVLYSYSSSSNVWNDNRHSSNNSLHVRVVGPDQVVALYDGVTPVTFPVAFQFDAYGLSNYRGVSCVYPCVYSTAAKEGNLPGKDPNFSLIGVHQYFNGTWVTADNCYWQGGHDNSNGGMKWTSINNFISSHSQKQECGYDPDHYKNTRYARGGTLSEGTKYNYYNNLKLNVSSLGLADDFESTDVYYHFAMEGGNLSADGKNPTTGTKAHYNNVGKVTLINYTQIMAAADEIKATYAKVQGHENEYCPEALDEYYANLALVACDPSNYFLTGNNVDACIERFRKSVAAIDVAKREPAKSRIQFGNIFDFDAFLASGSNDHGTLAGFSVDRATRTITCTGTGDKYSSMALNVFTYKLPVEEGEHYIFEFTSDSPYGDAMIFVPNDTGSGYDPNYVSWRPHGQGTQKVELTIPAGKKYVFFRVGVQGSSSEVTAHISRIRLYKSEYENWASNTPNVIPEPRLTNHCDGLLGSRNVRPVEYGTSLYSEADKSLATDLTGKHFCGWYKDEALTNKVTQTLVEDPITHATSYSYQTTDGKGLSGCTTLYAKYSNFIMDAASEVAATCLDAGHEQNEICEGCHEIITEGASIPTIAHHFRHDVSGVHDFVCDDCTAKNEQTPLDTDFVNYDALDQVYNTLDMNKYTDAGKAAITAKYNEYKAVLNNGYEYTTSQIDTAKAKAQADVDTAVANLLNTINTCNTDEKDSKVNKFNTSFEVLLNKNTPVGTVATQTDYYGDTVTLSVPEGYTAVKWSVAKYADKAHKELTSTYTVYGRDSIDIIADTENVVTLVVTKEKEEVQASQMVKVINSLGRVFSVQYGAIAINGTTLTIGGTEVEAPQIPFYTFTGWTQMNDDATGAKRVKAVYTIDDTQPLITIPAGATLAGKVIQQSGSTYKVYYDKSIVIDGSDIANFYAWAVKDGSKYQVVSYSASYDFNPVVNEEYVPILKSGNNFTVGGAAVTASNISCEAINAMTADQSVIFKLQNKLPFVYIQATKMLDGNTKARVYGRYTEGATAKAEIINYGVIYGTGTKTDAQCVIENVGTNVKVYNASLTNAIASGQFMYTLVKANGTFAREVSYNAYINYSYDYRDNKNDSEHLINTREYSGVKTADLT